MEESLSAVLEGVDYGVLLTDLDHLAILCNHKFGELFGIDPESVVRQDPESVRSQVAARIVQLDEWRANLEAIYGSPELVRDDELVLQNPHQVLRRHTGPVYGPQGTPIGRVWTFLDITHHFRRRKQLRIIRQIAQVVDQEPANVCQLIADLVSKNYGSVALISILEDEFLRFQTASGVPQAMEPPPGNALGLSYCQFCLAAGSPVVIQDSTKDEALKEMLPTKMGFTRYAGVPIYRADGSALGTFCILDHHSEQEIFPDDLDFLGVMAQRIGAEVERKERIERLELNLGTTSEELKSAQQQLVQSEQLAVTGTLAASVGHDIRNIIASAQIQLELVEGGDPDLIATVQGTLSRLEIMAHRLMSYARPKQLSREHTDLGEVVERVVELVRPQFAMAAVEVQVEDLLGGQLLLADAGRLEHLFVNLLINALHATPRGGTVEIALSHSSGHLMVQVSDNGSGIPGDVLPHVFQPFVTSKSDGFGLGLYSCRCIVQDHAGEISVESSAAGTTFKIQFPKAL